MRFPRRLGEGRGQMGEVVVVGEAVPSQGLGKRNHPPRRGSRSEGFREERARAPRRPEARRQDRKEARRRIGPCEKIRSQESY